MTSSKRNTHRTRHCQASTKAGKPCHRYAIIGGTVCPMHGGRAPQTVKRAAVRAELANWGLSDEYVDPGDTYLRLIAQSARRAALYARLLEEAFDAAGRLATEKDPVAAQEDVARIFRTGGVGALIGHTFSSGQDVGVFATGEAIRGLVLLEAEERDRCARWCKGAIDAGIEARKVELAQRQVDLLDTVLRGVLVRLGHRLDDPRVVEVVTAELAALPVGL